MEGKHITVKWKVIEHKTKKTVFVSTILTETVIIEAARLMLDCLRRFFFPLLRFLQFFGTLFDDFTQRFEFICCYVDIKHGVESFALQMQCCICLL